jgi:S-adenosylmethionine:tRNA ribosyltransferase-isomerase
VYARSPGAIAAPTAGLHFTTDILDDLARQGVERVAVTLHVGPGTFLPVRTDLVEDHTLESERFGIGDEAAAVIERALSERRRVVAVGSTSVRVLETVIREHGRVCPAAGRTSLFIHPPFEFRCVGALITNFHLPRSTLIMMVAAFAGTERTLHAYAEAVRERYRFFSYGDCMLVV